MPHDHLMTDQERRTYTLELYDEMRAVHPPTDDERRAERQRLAEEIVAVALNQTLSAEEKQARLKESMDLVGISFALDTIKAYEDGFRDGFTRGAERTDITH